MDKSEVEAKLHAYVPKGMTAYIFGVPIADLSREGLIGALGWLLAEKETTERRRKEQGEKLELLKGGKSSGILRTFRRR